MDRASAFQKGAFIGKRTYEVDVVNSVDTPSSRGYTELSATAESVETLRDGAEMPKRKSSQQARNGCQSNLMLEC